MATIVTGLTPSVGAVIDNIDLRTLDENDFKTAAAAFAHYHGFVFCDQHLSDDDLVAFSARFGPLAHAPVMENGRTAVESRPEIYLVSNIKDASGAANGSLGSGEAAWHTDMSYTANPPFASSLYAVEIRPPGGETLLCSMAAAHRTLPEALRARLAGLRIKHDGNYN